MYLVAVISSKTSTLLVPAHASLPAASHLSSAPSPVCPKTLPFWVHPGRAAQGRRAHGGRMARITPCHPIYQKAINGTPPHTPPAPILRFPSLPADCRAVIRGWLMRFSWQGRMLSPGLPVRQRPLCSATLHGSDVLRVLSTRAGGRRGVGTRWGPGGPAVAVPCHPRRWHRAAPEPGPRFTATAPRVS